MIPISLPPEALATPIVASLQDEYLILMDEFKAAHKQYQKSVKENSQLRELRSDIDIIEMEKENGTAARFVFLFLSAHWELIDY